MARASVATTRLGLSTDVKAPGYQRGEVEAGEIFGKKEWRRNTPESW